MRPRKYARFERAKFITLITRFMVGDSTLEGVFRNLSLELSILDKSEFEALLEEVRKWRELVL